MSSPRTVRLSPSDNVVVAVDPIAEGASAAGVTARARVMRGHKRAVAPIAQGKTVRAAPARRDAMRGKKMAVAPIAQGEPVRKYDQIIGFAAAPIASGD